MRLISLGSRVTSGVVSGSADCEVVLEVDGVGFGNSGSLSVLFSLKSFTAGPGLLKVDCCCCGELKLVDGVRALRRMDLGLDVGSGCRIGSAADVNAHGSTIFGFLVSMTTAGSSADLSGNETVKKTFITLIRKNESRKK